MRLDGPRGEPDVRGAALRRKLGPAFAEHLQRAVKTLEALPSDQWNSEAILAALTSSAKAAGAKLGDALQPIRVVLTGGTVSEPVNELLVLVGREAALDRLREGAAQPEPAG